MKSLTQHQVYYLLYNDNIHGIDTCLIISHICTWLMSTVLFIALAQVMNLILMDLGLDTNLNRLLE